MVCNFDPFSRQVRFDFGHNMLKTGFFDVGADNIACIAEGRIGGKSLFFSGPEPEKLGATCIYLKIQLFIVCKFVFKSIFAVVKFCHVLPRLPDFSIQ